MSVTTALVLNSSSLTRTAPVLIAATTATPRGRCSFTPTTPPDTMTGTTPRGSGRKHSTRAAPLSIFISRTSRPPTSSVVFHVGPWTRNVHACRGLSSISPTPTPRNRRTMTVSPRTIAGAAVLRSWATRKSVSMPAPCRSTTPREPESIAIDAGDPAFTGA